MKNEQEITNDEFANYLKGVQLKALWIDSCDCHVWEREMLAHPKTKQQLAFSYQPILKLARKSESSIAVMLHIQIVVPNEAGETDKLEHVLAELSVTYDLVYATPSKMTKELFEHFKRLTLRLHTMPFAREWFRNQSLQMGLKPILLPLALSHPAAARPASKTTKLETKA